MILSHTHSVFLSSFSDKKRISTRPEEHKTENFDEKFDSDCLFTDCFRVSNNKILLIGPSLLNLKQDMESMQFFSKAFLAPLKVKIEHLKLITRIWIDLPTPLSEIYMRGDLGNCFIKIRQNSSHKFAGKRVVTTLQKDNKLEWIADWVRFYRDVHGAEAVIIYDNGSTDYSLKQLDDLLKSIKGIETYEIVPWNFRYGPGPAANGKFWDSNFTQTNSLEHVRWFYCQDAKSLLNCDIDELIVANNNASIFTSVEKSLLGVIAPSGRWIVPIEQDLIGKDTIRHRDFFTMLKREWVLKKMFIPKNIHAVPNKWVIVPKKIPKFAILTTHHIDKYIVSRIPNYNFIFRHFRLINTNWFYKRSEIEVYDNKRHLKDNVLLNNFNKVSWHN